MLIQMSWPLFLNAWQSGETSKNAGGPIRWPVYLLMPSGLRTSPRTGGGRHMAPVAVRSSFSGSQA
jgi:TRAP-type mannitol/chloroaromatic compound transport system permease small subunit